MYFGEAATSPNIVFTHRSFTAARSARGVSRGIIQAPCEPNRVAAGHFVTLRFSGS